MPVWFWRASIQAQVYRLPLKTCGSDKEGFESEAWGIDPDLLMKLLHLKIFIAVWVVIMLTGFWVPDSLLEKNLFSARVMNWLTFTWICSCFVAFWMGTFIERSLYVNKKSTFASNSKLPMIPADKLETMVRTFKGLLFLISGVILIRVIWCVIKVGSLSNTFLFAVTQPNSFKFDIWQQTTIHGMGALSDLVIGCTVFAYAFFGLMKKYRINKSDIKSIGYNSESIEVFYRTSLKILMLSVLALIIYSILSNERIGLVMGFLGGGIVYLLVLRRFPLKNLIYMTFFLLVIWVVVEGARSQYFGSESFAFILEYAKNRLLLYLVSGLRNVDTVVNYLPNHTYGWYTFNFVFVTLKFDFLSSISDSLYGFTPFTIIPGFGVIPVFGTAYADFGLASLSYFVLMGFIYQRLYRKAILENNFLFLQLYALFLVVLLISFMPFMPMIARFWVNVLVIITINKSVTLGVGKLFSKKAPVLKS